MKILWWSSFLLVNIWPICLATEEELMNEIKILVVSYTDLKTSFLGTYDSMYNDIHELKKRSQYQDQQNSKKDNQIQRLKRTNKNHEQIVNTLKYDFDNLKKSLQLCLSQAGNHHFVLLRIPWNSPELTCSPRHSLALPRGCALTHSMEHQFR
jgi:predicted RNase H-like nuclease (RuvC/YqgF family)